MLISDGEGRADLKTILLTKTMDTDINVSLIEDNGTDFVLRCTKGIYRGMFVYLNLTENGETIGSDESCSLQIEDCDLEKLHVEIKYKYNEEQKKSGYHLTCYGPTLIKIRYDCPALIKNNMEITIGKQVYIIKTVHEDFNELYEWLSIYDLQSLKHFFGNNMLTLKQIKQSKLEQLVNQLQSFNATQDQVLKFREAYEEIDLIIQQHYDTFKINLIDKQNGTTALQFGWTGATISSRTQRYQKPPDILLKKQEIDDLEENTDFELLIKFIKGKYWIWGSKADTYNAFYKQNTEEVRLLQPDDVIKLNNLELLVQRFNYGYFADIGSKRTQEDSYAIIQDLQVSSRVPVSCYAIYDGHNGNQCVNYVSQNLLDNIREYFNQESKEFDLQQKFHAFLYENLRAAFKETDSNFFTEVLQSNQIESGCVSALVMIIGDYIVSANCGDSRAMLSRAGTAINLTEDHKPNFPIELARIKRKGGEIIGSRLGALAVSRAFGDFSEKKKFKKNTITAKPDIRVTKIDFKTDEFILLCSDGIIDGFGAGQDIVQGNIPNLYYQNQKLVDFVREFYKTKDIGCQDPQEAAKFVVLRAYQNNMKYRRMSDNISCIIVNLTRGII